MIKVYLHDDFTEGSINASKWNQAGTVTVENAEAIIEKTTQPGNSAVGGQLASKVIVPPSLAITFDHRFVTNTNLQSGTGFWSTDSIFFRMTDPDWNSGENNQIFMTYHADTDAVVDAILSLYHRVGGSSPTLLGKTLIPLDLFDSLDVEGAGAVLRNLQVSVSGKRFKILVRDILIDEFEDASPLHQNSPVQFGSNSPLNLTTKFSVTNVLVTNA